MPITHGVEVKAISEDEFYLLDYKVMGLAFSIHREMGRFWNEKIYHFRGGEENVLKKTEIGCGSRILGTQKVHLINSDTTFKISSITKGKTYYERDLQRFIRFTRFKAMQWINFDHDKIVFKTIAP